MTAQPAPVAAEKLTKIRFLLTDVDGVLTNGDLHYDHAGNESKVFHVLDGAGFAYWHRAGFASGFLSGRPCAAVEHRARHLKIHEVHLGNLDKLPVLLDIAARWELQLDEIAYIGDDLLDLAVLRQVGLAVTVPNGRPEVHAAADFITATPGGRGVVREVVEMLLKAKGMWDEVVATDGRA
ncbi:MAG: HAD hydrolase family protein [Planctomycetes bacterium]|nr:HAD hydrolase family protein [Planctomycetota bacterium]MCB9870248.1 HAD hydrolase family protein [Planctomycetota bacterium]MCB9888171.1 HAD hydrolase family protein [Planctomycetota bacterium]